MCTRRALRSFRNHRDEHALPFQEFPGDYAVDHFGPVHRFPDAEVAEGIPIAASALTVVINRQTAGYAYIPVP